MSNTDTITVMYPIYYLIKVIHRDGTTEMVTELGKRNMSPEERKQFMLKTRNQHKSVTPVVPESSEVHHS